MLSAGILYNMDFYNLSVVETADKLNTDIERGLAASEVQASAERYGGNTLSRKKPKSLLRRIFDELTEPMMLILLFAHTAEEAGFTP